MKQEKFETYCADGVKLSGLLLIPEKPKAVIQFNCGTATKKEFYLKGQNYNPPTQYLFLDEKRKMGMVKRIQKQIIKFGLTNEDLSFITN